jgi:hypothetical protein
MVSEFLQQNQTYSNCIPYNEREPSAGERNFIDKKLRSPAEGSWLMA